jgi:transcriptional regulator with XRE-family HTH domain
MVTAPAIARLEQKAAIETIESAREAFGLNYVELARSLGVDRRTVLRYRKRTVVPSRRAQARMEKLRDIHRLLELVLGDRDSQLEWLYGSAPLVRGQRPIDLMRKGELDEVLAVLTSLYSVAQV